MKKRFLSLLLAFSMMLTLLPAAAFADSPGSAVSPQAEDASALLQLEIGEDGYPVGTEGGTKDVTNGDGWSYCAGEVTMAPSIRYLNLHPDFTQEMYDHSLKGKTVRCPVYFNASIQVTDALFGCNKNYVNYVRSGIQGLSIEDCIFTSSTVNYIFAFSSWHPLFIPTGTQLNGSTIASSGWIIVDSDSSLLLTVTAPADANFGSWDPVWEVYNYEDDCLNYEPIAVLPNQVGSYSDRTMSFTMPSDTDRSRSLVLRIKESPTFQLTPPQDLTYNGASKTATVTLDDSTDGITVRYYQNGQEVIPIDAGTYTVKATYNNEEFYVGEFTINPRPLTEADFDISTPDGETADGTEKPVTVTPKPNFVDKNDIHITYTQNGEPVDVPKEAGTYQYVIEVASDNYSFRKEGTFTLRGVPSGFLFTPPQDLTYDGTSKTADVTLDDSKEGITVKYYRDGKETDPIDAGTYTVKVDFAGNTKYAPVTGKEVGTFAINPRKLTEEDVVLSIPDNATADGTAKLVTVTDKPGFVDEKGIHITYTQNGEPVDEPTEAGTYHYTVTVDPTSNYIGFSTEGDFTLLKQSEILLDANDHLTLTATDASGNTLPEAVEGTPVYLSYTVTDPEYDFNGWDVLAQEDLKIEKDADGNWFFIMPAAGVRIAAKTWNTTIPTDPDPDNPYPTPDDDFGQVDDGAGIALAVGGAVLGTAAVGTAVYYAGTTAYLKSVLPAGTAIPKTRAQLAELLWTNAGKPAPKTVLADTSDTTKAITWCVENGLLNAEGKSESHVTRVQVIKAWNAAQELNKKLFS